MTPSRIAPDTALISSGSGPEAARAVAAFLNSTGGRVLIGIQPDGSVTGISGDIESHRLQGYLRSHIRPSPRFSLIVRNVGDRSIALIDVPAGTERPYVFEDRIFVWKGAKVTTAGPLDISAMISTRREVADRWERQPALDVGMEDLDERQLVATRASFAERGIRPTRKSVSLSDILAELNLEANGQILNSAVVLFARREAVLPQSRVRAAAFATPDRNVFRENRLFEGNLFDLFEQIAAFLERQIPSQSEFADYTRHDQLAIPPFVIREGVMNALVHRDYSQVNANITIALHPDRLEIWNPGGLPEGISPDNLPRTHVSRPRNPDIAHVAFLRGLVEQWGSGTGRIVEECRSFGLPDPRWDFVAGGLRLTVYTVRRPSEPTSAALNDRALRFIQSTFPGQMIGVDEYHQGWAGEVTNRTARRDLTELVEAGFLIQRSEHPAIFERTDRLLS